MADAVWIPVNAEMKGFIGTLVKEASGAAQKAGQKVTSEFGKTGKDAGQAMASGLSSQAAKIEQVTAKVANARKVEAKASADVTTAEQELQAMRSRADASASQIAAAEQKLTTAKNRHQDATRTLTRVEGDLESVRAGGEASSTALARSEDNLAKAKTQAQTATDKLQTAELKLGEAKEKQLAKAQQVREAEANLDSVRQREGATAKEIAQAERQLETARNQSASADKRVAVETGNVAKKRAELASATDNVAAKSRTHKATQQDVAAAERRAGNEAETARGKIRGLGDDMDGAARSGGGFVSSLGGFAKKAALAGGAFLGVSGATQALSGGFERLNNLDRADIMFRNIGLSAEQAGSTMDDLNDLVTGTSVSLADAAGTASMLMQAGVEAGKPLNDSIKALTNISAIAGGSAEDVGLVLMQIKAAGRLMGGDAMQLQQRGVNIYGYLADSLGMSFEEVKELGEEGKITYEQVVDAINAKTGDLAKEMGETLPAKMGNFRTAVSSAAAEFIGPFIDPATRGVEMLTQKLKDARPAIQGFAEGIKSVFTWLGDHPAVLAGMATAVSSLAAGAAAVKAVGIAKEALNAAKAIKTVADVMKVLNLTFLASPVGMVVAGLTAVTVGLTLFFTKTETGQKIWQGFMDGLRAGGEWVTGTLVPAFVDFGTAVGDAFTWIGEKLAPVREGIGAAFDWIGGKLTEFGVGVGQFYQTWVQPQIEFFRSIFELGKANFQVFIGMLGQVATFVGGAFQQVGNIISGVTSALIMPAWTMIQAGAQVMATIASGAFDLIKLGFQFVGQMIQSVWVNIIEPVWGLFRDGAGLLADILTGNFDNIGTRFESMGTHLHEIVMGPINVAMDYFRNLVSLISDAWVSFQTTVANVVTQVKNKITEMVTNIAEIPGKIKGVFADAGNWLLSAGRNIISGLWSGMQQMWDNVTGWLSDLPGRIRNSIGSVSFGIGGVSNADGSFAQYVAGGIAAAESYANGGGSLPTRAVIERPHGKRGLVQWAEAETGGEAFIPLAPGKRERSTAILDRVAGTFGYALVDQMTGVPYQSTYRGNLGPQVVGTFADGGITGDDLMKFLQGGSVNGYQAAYPLEGAPYLWGGGHPRYGDCSGTVGTVAALSIGENPAPRRFATGTQASWLSSHGFLRGRGGEGDLRIGLKNGGPAGGHTSATLPNGVNFEMGGARGNGQLGGRAAGAWDSYYNEFFYLPMQEQKWVDPEVTGLKDLSADERQVVVAAVDTAGMSTTAAVQQGPQTPYEAFATTFAAEMGNRSVAQIGFDAVADFFGVDPKATRKVLFTPMDELLGVADVNQNAAVGNPSTSVAGAHAAQIHDDAVTTMTPQQLASDPQLSRVKDVDVVKQPNVPEWGPQFFAHEIANQAKTMGLDKLGAKIGIATALVESGNPLKMYANRAVPESLSYRHDALGSDYDSVGLFQQRNNGAWGTVKDRMTPASSAKMFFAKLQGFDYRSMDPGAAAQKVQVSAFPDRYGKQIAEAERLLSSTGVFDLGGIAGGMGWMRKAVIEPERTLSPRQTVAFEKMVDRDFVALDGTRNAGRGEGTTVVINIDGQEVMRQRLDEAEEQIDLHTDEILGLKAPRRPRPMAVTRGGAM